MAMGGGVRVGVARLQVAPMMDVTDRHMRRMLRMLTRRTELWSEMVVDKKLIHNAADAAKMDRFAGFDDAERPLVLQLGGNVPAELGRAVRVVEDAGFRYDAVNLNCGCPSAKVNGKSAFGASMMLRPAAVAEATVRMAEGARGRVPVTVKCRAGVDGRETYDDLAEFVRTVAAAGAVGHFVVHARKALLGARMKTRLQHSVPALMPERVERLRADFPSLSFTYNGGVGSLAEAARHLDRGLADGVMIGRAVAEEPWMLARADTEIFGEASDPVAAGRGLARDRLGVLHAYAEYAQEQRHANPHARLHALLRPALPLFNGVRQSKVYRRLLGDAIRDSGRQGDPAAVVERLVRRLRADGFFEHWALQPDAAEVEAAQA